MEASKNPSNGNLLHLTSEQRPLLLQAICHFLESSGFSRTLKKFLSEASIQRGSWKSCLLDLEDACCMYLVSRSQNNANDISINYDKRSVKIVGVDANVKSKEKKKKKSENECPSQDVNVCRTEAEGALGDILCEEKSSKKAKDKKKKERESVSEKNKTEADEGLYTKSLENGVKEKNIKQSMAKSEEASEQEKKSSKKRKKSLPEENKVDALGEASTDSKHKKTGSGDGETDGKTERATMQLESGQVGSQTPSSTNGKYSKALVEENDGDKSALKKNSAKKQTGSAEPRTLNAFQRVKAEEVEFVDERLQDNSYWAKDGAETGYGAKAQEVLGQVRGRDFRHEKTKKKRGSYRGGQIDLQSHSVKFSYSDEDE